MEYLLDEKYFIYLLKINFAMSY